MIASTCRPSLESNSGRWPGFIASSTCSAGSSNIAATASISSKVGSNRPNHTNAPSRSAMVDRR